MLVMALNMAQAPDKASRAAAVMMAEDILGSMAAGALAVGLLLFPGGIGETLLCRHGGDGTHAGGKGAQGPDTGAAQAFHEAELHKGLGQGVGFLEFSPEGGVEFGDVFWGADQWSFHSTYLMNLCVVCAVGYF